MTLLLDRGALGPSLLVVGDSVLSAPASPAANVGPRLDCAFDPRAIVEPGAVDAHTHLYSALAPLGMPAPARAPKSFVEILELVWWRLDRALDEASLRASARLYVAEALLAGTTAIVDHHESPGFLEGSLDVLADAAEELGARVLLAYGATERNGGRDEARRGLAECERLIRSRSSPLVRGLVGLHASFTASDATVREAGEIARALGTALHVHVAEDAADVDDARRRGFEGPLERLAALGALPPRSILAHGVHLGAASVRRAAEASAWLVQNPRSNANNHVGYPLALSASPRVALGTDGFAADMAAERAALFSLAAESGERASAAELAARATAGFALVADFFPGRFGPPVEGGSSADLVVRVPGRPARHVVVGGRLVVRDGRLEGGDLEAIRAEAREQAARLWARLPPG